MKQLLFLLIPLLFTTSCDTVDVYEQTAAFGSHAWVSANKISFTFSVADTTSSYNIYAVVRHTDAYHFNNMWMQLKTVAPDNSVTDQQVKLKLGDNAKGWLGSAMDDIIEHRVLINKYPIKLKKGNYTFVLQQIMREDPLQYVMNAGIRVEKAGQ
ncbi:MAG TPA: gliding motility lipoprotein GldH [Panacibacter sp.]|nr:gliding motility lipoprotein GldH [Panacibacter sp.]HNP46762.1 gliding motility lipoprotein GldH [Panacibacter sp.]